MAQMKDNNVSTQWDEPTDSDKELISFVVEHTDRWRDHRDQNFLQDWLEYERIFRGVWDASSVQLLSKR
jgi:hypothetical protein